MRRFREDGRAMSVDIHIRIDLSPGQKRIMRGAVVTGSNFYKGCNASNYVFCCDRWRSE